MYPARAGPPWTEAPEPRDGSFHDAARSTAMAAAQTPRLHLLALLLATLLARPAAAAIGLTTVPSRDGVRLTIYNGVDLTLVQEYRTLVLRRGLNRIQYQWAGTLIDSTSLELRPLTQAGGVEVADVVYPKGAPATLVWEVRSEVEGPVRFEISGFTSGLGWSADYVLRADAEERKAELEGFVSIVNGSGEDYPGAEVRLVVGTVHLVESIRDLATRQLFERRRPLARDEVKKSREVFLDAPAAAASRGQPMNELSALEAPVVESRRFGDYHLFTIGGTHALANGATTRLRAIASKEPMALEVLYRVAFGQDRADKVYRFVNDAAHELPAGPLPEGAWHLFRAADARTGQLSYSGRTTQPYVPPDQKVELALGVDPAIVVRQRHEWHRETGHIGDHDGRIVGWYVHDAHRLKLVNTRAIPISVEYMVATPGREWKLTGLEGERRDERTFRVQARVEPGRTLELGPFVITSKAMEADVRRGLPDPAEPPKLPAVATKP